MNYELAEQDGVENYQLEVAKILEAMGFDDALVTDESTVSDFLPSFPSKILRQKKGVTDIYSYDPKNFEPIPYTQEDEDKVSKIRCFTMTQINLLFVGIDVEVKPSSLILDLARILSKGKGSIH